MKIKIKDWIMKCQRKEIVKVRELASMIGKSNFLRFQIVTISVYMNALQPMKNSAVAKGSLSCKVKINLTIKGNLETILRIIKVNQPRYLSKQTAYIVMSTDASETAWGATLEILEWKLIDGGEWTSGWHLNSSNQREAAAVLMALRFFHPHLSYLQTSYLLLQTDNTATEYNLRRWRASTNLIHIVRKIAELLNQIQIHITTLHIPGINNSQADALSRMAWRRDYQVKKEIMQSIFQQLNFFPNLDAFATRTLRQCRRYFSPLKDGRAEARDAFQPPWTGELMLIHPPIEQIPRAIAKAKRDGVIALFILPDWVLTMYYQTFPTIIAALNLGLATHVLQEGKKMKQLQLKLPPGDLIAVLINTLEENQFTETQLDNQASTNNQLMI
ncbi:MAG: hypothetical protein EZS28_031676 [Streblomastix strix]|uniref:Uncharacterized protein n=1 Tax=Streblomastix strix TaxID=222440 RepID=A0A5J4UQU8_9EUKA|nr:MAG: hypothetical protein EZS28_031676 [Streblomastix strix]